MLLKEKGRVGELVVGVLEDKLLAGGTESVFEVESVTQVFVRVFNESREEVARFHEHILLHFLLHSSSQLVVELDSGLFETQGNGVGVEEELFELADVFLHVAVEFEVLVEFLERVIPLLLVNVVDGEGVQNHLQVLVFEFVLQFITHLRIESNHHHDSSLHVHETNFEVHSGVQGLHLRFAESPVQPDLFDDVLLLGIK